MKRFATFLAVLALLLSSVMTAAAAETGKAPPKAKAPAGVHLKAGTKQLGKNPQALRNQGDGLYVVQFSDVISEDSWKALELAGAEVDTYLPDFAFLARMSGEAAAMLAEDDLVAGVEKYRPEWKLPPGLAGKDGKFRIQRFGGQQTIAEMKARDVADLARSEDVTFIDLVRENILFNDAAAGVIKVSSAGGPWTNGLTGSGQVIGIADTGLDNGNTSTMHADLRNRLQVTPIALGRAGNWSDTHGHGTHVAGSVAGDGTNSGGSIKGMAPAAKIVFQSVMDSSGGLGGIPDDLNTLFTQAAGNGATIHTNSWGVPLQHGGNVYDAQAQQADQYMWNNKNFTILFAAGNDGDASQSNSVTTPSTAKNVITVGASENNRPTFGAYADNINSIATFSSRGLTTDGRVKPDVVAPGTYILSTRSALAADSAFWANYNSYYAYMGGTSMATPVTAGATGLVRQFYTSVKGITPSSSLIKASLINGAVDMGYGWKSKDQGWGRLDLTNTLYPIGGRVNWFENEANSLATNGTRSYTFTAQSGQILKFTLVWTDYPGGIQASKELVNDLDLEVTAPGGGLYKGNCFVSNTASTTCAAYDRVNNVENVYFAAPAVGTYTVTVKGYNVPNGPQPYSLVASGSGLTAGGSGGDTEAPTVNITAPAAGATVSATTTVTASASDNVGVTRVEFYVDGALQSTDSASPWSWAWDTTTAANGSHSLTAKAYDAANNVGTSAAVPVTVSNTSTVTTVTETFTGSVSSGASKYVYLDVTAPGTISLSLNWATATSDIDMYLNNPSGTQVAKADSGTARPEVITYNATATGRYRVQIKSYSGSSGAYTLTATHPIDPARTAALNQTGSLTSGGTRDYNITVGAAGAINLKLNFPSGTDFDLYLYNPSGTQVASATSASLRPESISYAAGTTGTYRVRVKAYSGSGSYTLTGYYPK
ncbi:MAG TPA: S8 family serine peptidase [Symbiobacteriaceae bacterium]|nr:S8 family serine peptidase [Symbiobacteriaceae bacterium]